MSQNDHPASPRRSNILAVLAIAIAVLAVVLLRQTDHDSSRAQPADAPSAGQDADSKRAAQISGVLSGLTKAWTDRDRTAFLGRAGSTDASRQWSGQTYASLAALPVDSFTARLVTEDPAGLGADGTFEAEVEIGWTPAPSSGMAPGGSAQSTVNLILRPSTGGYDVEGAAAAGGPMPVWLTGALEVDRTATTTVIRVDRPDAEGSADAERLDRTIAEGVRDVRRVVGKTTRKATIVLPSSAAQAAQLLGQPVTELSQIAAVTATVDGRVTSRSPVYVVVNPPVFAGLDTRGSQVVISHELTHAFTDVTTTDLPLWIVEGFADYVALRGENTPVRKSAAQILEQVRDDGVPKTLPGTKEFGSSQHGLGATYESAWLIFQMLGKRYDNDAVVDFYGSARLGTEVDQALRRSFGLDQEALTRAWRTYLRNLAR